MNGASVIRFNAVCSRSASFMLWQCYGEKDPNLIRDSTKNYYKPIIFLAEKNLKYNGALKNQVQHFWEKMLHEKKLHTPEY
jgi:hypothetical protein